MIRRPHIELETAIVGIAPGDKCVYVATADSSIRCFAAKARKQFTLHTPALYQCGNHLVTLHAIEQSMSTQEPITNLERLDLKGQREAILILAALTNGDVRMYRGRISWMSCG